MSEEKKITPELIKKILNRIQWYFPLYGEGKALRNKANAIYSASLEKEFKLTGSEVRDIIRDLRREGQWILPTPKGYCWAISEEEKEELIKDLEGTGDSLYKTASALRRARAKGCRQLNLIK